MSKIATPNYDHQSEEDYSKSNSVEVQNSTESLATLTPPDLFMQAPKEQKQEHEEIQELEGESITFDVPTDGEDVSSDDDSDANDDESDSAFNEILSFKKAQNPTSIPFQLNETAQLKQNFQSTYGYDLSDTKVIHNSSQPAQFKAHAFAQGNEVHLGPGQDHQLPHELAHVVQQKQGKVKPTGSDAGMLINDDISLENEADQMGQKVSQMKAFDLDNSETSKLVKGANNQTYQFSKPDAKKKDDGKVEKKISLAIPSLELAKKDFKYVTATANLATGLEVGIRVDKSMTHLPDEIAVGEKGLAVKKEGPNLAKSEIADKINLEVKNGIEINSFGGKVGIECKLGGDNIFTGIGVEFSFVDIDWKEKDIEDKLKILTATFKSPEKSYKKKWTIAGEQYEVTGKLQLQGELKPNKAELARQIVMKFGHLFTAELAIAGGMILAGGLAIGNALHSVYMGKDMRNRIDLNIEKILSFGRGFKTGYTGKSSGSGSLVGLMQGLNARTDSMLKMPPIVFEEKLKTKGMDSVFFPAMYQAVQGFKKNALDQFKKDHDLSEDDDSNNDLKLFKKVLDASCSSNYLQKKILEI